MLSHESLTYRGTEKSLTNWVELFLFNAENLSTIPILVIVANSYLSLDLIKDHAFIKYNLINPFERYSEKH